MALVVKGKVNINEFIDLSKSEKLLPSMTMVTGATSLNPTEDQR